MKIPKRSEQEGILEYGNRLSELYATVHDAEIRKKKGQVFTPGKVSTFMVNLFEIRHDTIRILDPGAGTGVLTAAFCERVLNINKKVNLIIDVYENDSNVLPFLETVLESCKIELERKGHAVEYNIYNQDFIFRDEGHVPGYGPCIRGRTRVAISHQPLPHITASGILYP